MERTGQVAGGVIGLLSHWVWERFGALLGPGGGVGMMNDTPLWFPHDFTGRAFMASVPLFYLIINING